MGEEETVTFGKDTLYGILIVMLAGLLVVSVFTQGFGVVKADSPVVNLTCPNTQTNSTQTNTTATKPALPSLTVGVGSYPALGSTSAPVTLVQFSEFQCPYCARLYQQTEVKLKTNYMDTGKLKMYFRDYPLPPQYHPQAAYAAVAARCADDQDKFWEMHHKLFNTQSDWSGNANASELFKGYAIALGMDNATFSGCYDNQSHLMEISIDLQDGQELGVGGTPSNFIIIPKTKISDDDMRSAVEDVNSQYGGVELYEDGTDYTILIPGAYPYEVFDAILSAVDY